jgi:hypothetical protein
MLELKINGRTVTVDSKEKAKEMAAIAIGDTMARAELFKDGNLIEIIGNDLKAGEIPCEVLIRGIPKEHWGLAWEAIVNAQDKNLVFATQGRLFAFISTYIYRKDFNETYYLSRTKAHGREYIRRSLPVTEAMEIYGIAEIGEDGDSKYGEMIGGAYFDGSLSEVAISNGIDEIEYGADLSRLGLPEEFIERILDGERLTQSRLNADELRWLKLLREEYVGMRTKARA